MIVYCGRLTDECQLINLYNLCFCLFLFASNTTHVVFKDGLMSTYKRAQSWNIPIVSILWIEACKVQRRLCEPQQFPISNIHLYEHPELYGKMAVSIRLYLQIIKVNIDVRRYIYFISYANINQSITNLLSSVCIVNSHNLIPLEVVEPLNNSSYLIDLLLA